MLISGYVLVRVPDGSYVARGGSEESYTRTLERAKVFPDLDSANRERCKDNERAVPLASLFGGAMP